MNRSTITKDVVVVFPADMGRYPAIDRMELILYSDRHYDCRRIPRVDLAALESGEPLGLSEKIGPKLNRIAGTRVPFLGWERDEVVVKQWLGGYGGRHASHGVAQSITFNPLAEVAREVRAAARPGTRERATRAKRNLVHPSIMSRPELFLRTTEVAMTIIDQYRADYAILLRRLFGIEVAESDVRCSCSLIEVAWDVPCVIPALAIRALHDPWLRGVPDAKLVVRAGSAAPADREFSAWADGTLRARHAKGYSSKVYGSSSDTLRFEAQAHAHGQRRLIGHRVQLVDLETFRADVQQLGMAAYGVIQHVQEDLTTTRMMPVAEALCAGVDPRRKPIFRDIVSELMTSGRVATLDRSRYKVLCAMRDEGYVRITKPKGYWTASASYARALKSFLRHANIYRS